MNLPLAWLKQKPLRMAWTVQKDGRRAYLVGTAHFFPYSFARSLNRLLQKVDTAIFEGPLDEESMSRIAAWGRQADSCPSLTATLEPEAVKEINRQLGRRLADQAGYDSYLLWQPTRPNYLEMFSQGVRPWMAFFSIWSTYLDWRYSMDMDGFQIARKQGKEIHFLETIEEQLAVLDGIPFERILNQLNDVQNWPNYTDRYVHLFLQGNMDELLALTSKFFGRGRPVVSERDALLFDRMTRLFEAKEAVAFVGLPHIPGVARLFRDAGYRVSQGVE